MIVAVVRQGLPDLQSAHYPREAALVTPVMTYATTNDFFNAIYFTDISTSTFYIFQHRGHEDYAQ